MYEGVKGTASLAKNDPILTRNNGNRVLSPIASGSGISTGKVLRQLMTCSLGEFDPALWDELKDAGVLAQSVGRIVYERIRESVEKSYLA